ncbi:MAG TPA: peptidoglycan-binding domain-containing protein [Candidatus Limnocylindrales bacterium]|nr:peptidoglycan-binding domain-containing protein [Candidatus Limnocylindrales bacterium]
MVGHPQRAAERSDPRPGTAPPSRAPTVGPARRGTRGIDPIASQVLLLQASIGNRSVTDLLHPEPVAVQRQGDGVGTLPAGNPLVGLKRGDGLVFGTFDRRTRVRALQERLNARIAAGLAEDGMFGPLTSDALATFQASVGLPVEEPVSPDTADALLGRAAPGGGISGVPAGSEGVVRAAVTEAGTKLVQSKLVLDVAASGLRQAGSDIGTSTRPGAGGVQAGLTIAANQLIEASTLIAAAGAKMIAGGPSTGAFPVPGGNQLVGLRRGDGLDLGTEDRRPRVVELQERLNERMSAELKLDGMFGPKTQLALNEFQRSIRVPETDVVDQVTGDALETGLIAGEAVAVPGGEELELAGQRLADVGLFVRNAATSLALSNTDSDLRASQFLDASGQLVGTSATLTGQAGTSFRTSSTREATQQGGVSLSTAGTFQASAAQGFRDAATQILFAGGILDQSASANLTLAANSFDGSSNLVTGAGADILRAAEVMTPAA